MRMQRRQPATRVLLVVAVVLASLWAGGPALSVVGGSADQLAASRSLPGLEPAAPPDRLPALRPPAGSSSQSGRLPPVLGVLVAALALAPRRSPRRQRAGLARGRSPVRRAHLAARAPPSLQPA